jgi:hypothetical protein
MTYFKKKIHLRMAVFIFLNTKADVRFLKTPQYKEEWLFLNVQKCFAYPNQYEAVTTLKITLPYCRRVLTSARGRGPRPVANVPKATRWTRSMVVW